MSEIKVKISLDDASKETATKEAEEMISLIEKASSLADELARKVGEMRLGFKVGRVDG